MNSDRFSHQQYLIRRKLFKLLGAAFHVYDPAGNVVLYSKQRAFRLREDIRLYASEDMTDELLRIQARSIVDFSAAYDIVDSRSNERLGSLKRKGFSSLVRDQWMIFDAAERQIGSILEDSTARALIRRFVESASFFMPQKYHVEMMGSTVCTLQQHFNPIVFKMTVDFSPDASGRLDRRLGLAAATLVSAIEGREQ